ncbi:MAG: serine hydrolase, partial [Stackebrandtia sp.]
MDAPGARYWPEFAAEGKADLAVRWLLSHRAGLPAIHHVLSVEDIVGWMVPVATLA